MKKIAMIGLFVAVASVLFASQGFAQWYYGINVYNNAPEINVSSQVSVANNVYQPAGGASITLSTASGYAIGGAYVSISTVNIGNITANKNGATVDGLNIFAGGVFGVQLEAYADPANGSLGNIACNENFLYLKNSSSSLNTNAAVIMNIKAAKAGDITANSNKIEMSNVQNIAALYGAYCYAIISSSSSFYTVTSNANEISITSSSIFEVEGSVINNSRKDSISNITSNNNKITISYSTVNYVIGAEVSNYSSIYDNFSDAESMKKVKIQANNNSVSILNSDLNIGSALGANIYGENISANGNSVSIQDSLSNGWNAGVSGWADLSGEANGNSIFIKNMNESALNGEMYGAYFGGGNYSYQDIGFGVFAANNNSARVENLTNNGYVLIAGAYNNPTAGTGTANQNSVYVSNSNPDDVYGGYIESYDGDLTTEEYANGNSVTMENSTATSVYGGYSVSGNTCLSYDAAANSTYGVGHTLNFANGNTVSVASGSASNIFGGFAQSKTSNAQANNNSVMLENISGSVATVAGGDALGKIDGEKVKAINNTVTITGNLNAGMLYGGFAINSGTGGADYFTGNTLNVKGGNITASYLGGFEKYNFYIQNSTAPVISVSNGDVFSSSGVALSGTNVQIFLPNGANFTAGDKIALIQSSLAGFTGTPNNTESVAKQGAAWLNTFDIYVDTPTNTLNAGFVKKELNPQTKSLSEGAAAGAALAGQGAESAAGLLSGVQSGNIEAVGAISGGNSKYNTGSSVDMNSIGAAAGIAKKFKSITAGVFIEYANANFDTDANDTKGSGKASAIGGGIAAKKDIKENVYAEGLIRAGQLSNDCKTDLTDEHGTHADFDYTSMYFGVSLGAGYISKVSEKISLDFSGKYMFTNVGGDEVNLPTGEKYKLDSVISNRLKLGVKGEYKASETIKPYALIAYDYELSGGVNAKIDGQDIDAPTLNGGTLSAGIGASAKVIKKLTLDLSVQGYTGVREGFAGLLKVKYEI